MRVFTALILVLFGVILLAGGIYLAVLGGSWYYIIAGLMLLVSGVLLFRRSIASLLVYAVLMLGTIIWAVWEVGTDFWALAPRLDVLCGC
jgi:quinoprotein glucose dehydrogenase